MINKYKITNIIENFAPIETQEAWDCSGWLVETANPQISKIMLALTVTEDILNQARQNNCDMIISHHPLFFIPLEFRNINIYCAHTNFDKAQGGTSDILIKTIFPDLEIEQCGDFLRICSLKTPIKIEDFVQKLKFLSPNLRYVNNHNITEIKKIAFCAGSGSDFIQESFESGADALVTGDLKFHAALESPIVLFDIGHFESEILSLKVLKNLIGNKIEIIFAKETGPFKYL